MNIYLISQDKNNGYDTYDSAVVFAESEEEARNMHPSGKPLKDGSWYEYPVPGDPWRSRVYPDVWCEFPSDVSVQLLGVASDPEQGPGVILGSFNAG